MRILVLGGAGYIGSHTALELVRAGEDVIVADNLVTGHREAIPAGVKFYQGDLHDFAFLDNLFQQEQIDAVIHFAAYSLVGESVTNPLKYYDNNLCGTRVLLEAMVKNHVDKIVFPPPRQPMANRSTFRFWKPTGRCRQTLTEKPSWQWKRCSTGRQTHMDCGMFPAVFQRLRSRCQRHHWRGT